MDKVEEEEGRTGLQLNRAVSVTLSLAKTIMQLHDIGEKGILYLDLKPQNVLVDSSVKSVVLCNFGISKVIEGTNLAATFTAAGGKQAGTTNYKSPEQAGAKGPDGKYT